ncbi:cytochrome P450 [Haliea sp. E17]|uniref:cytochrome P450 n=1 Tax=Haliea sp. E17 TaxID=3401576 RepID=UPI003AAC1FC7
MQTLGDLDLAHLPIEHPDFYADPQRHIETARLKHPWLARFDHGYIVYGLQASRDLLYMDDKMGPHFSGVVDHFGAAGTDWARFMSDQIATTSGERHARLRKSLAAAFTPRSANTMRPLMRQTISKLLDEWAPRGSFDFVEFASHFPITVMCGILGVPAGPVRDIHRAIEAQILCLTMNRDLFPSINEGYEILREFTAGLIAKRENAADADCLYLLDTLIAVKQDGHLSEDELRDLVITLILAGYDTTKNEFAFVLYNLIGRHAVWQRCAEDLAYCQSVIQEALRHTSVATPSRTLYGDVEYAGIHFPKGTHLCFALAISGRDPEAYSRPTEFSPGREQTSRHLAFGRGTHICLGQFLATAQLEEGIHLLAQRVDNVRLDGQAEWRPFRAGIWGMQSLPVRFDLTQSP